MARLRNWTCYRDLKRAYTRFSKYKKLCYVRARPANRISRYTGGTQERYQFDVHLVAGETLQIRDNALESARQVSNRALEKVLAKAGYFIQMRVYPHHILRENPLAAGAGADRLSTGMAHNYGKPIGLAAQIKKGQPIFTVKTNKENVPLARRALKRAMYKLPCHCSVVVKTIEQPPQMKAIKASAKAKAVAA
ncbi:50S ribosomal protein L16 [Candidatus Woesearchaeota archaeon]|nr:MAG: 50S ribosomal protein L16 [Candidatus Woesearchaeota archaeon]